MSSTEGADPAERPEAAWGTPGDGPAAPPATNGGAAPGQPQPGFPPPGYPAPGYGYGGGRPIPPPDVAGGEQAGRRAALAIWVGLGAALVQTVCSVIAFASTRESFEQLVDLFDDISAGRTPVQPRTTNPEPLVLVAGFASQLGGIVFLIVGIVFLIWFHKALSNARALGLRLTHSPAWGVAGFLVPIINFWFPYQSMRDLFPEGHPARSRVGRWWAAYLGATYAGAFSFGAYLLVPVAGYVLAAGVAVLYVIAAVTVRELIAESIAAHQQLGADQGWPATPVRYPMPAPGYPGGPPPGAPPMGPMPGPMPGPAAPVQPPKDPWGRN